MKNCFDPSCFGDTAAMQTQWTPMAGGTTFDTYEMVIVNDNRIEFRPIRELELFSIILSFCLSIFEQKVFDKSKNLFWKGRAEYDFYIDSCYWNNAKLNNIHAIQLLYKSLDDIDGEGSDDNYELNIVLDDSRRIYVVSYADKNRIRYNADILSKFLNKPIWDAINLQTR